MIDNFDYNKFLENLPTDWSINIPETICNGFYVAETDVCLCDNEFIRVNLLYRGAPGNWTLVATIHPFTFNSETGRKEFGKGVNQNITVKPMRARRTSTIQNITKSFTDATWRDLYYQLADPV